MSTPFTAAQAREHGYGRGALRGRSVRRELHGVYVPGWAEDSVLTRVESARRVLPEDVRPDGVTALHLLGVSVGSAEPLRFVTAHPHQVRRRGVRVRRSTAAAVAGAARPEAVPEPEVHPTVRAKGCLVGRVDLLFRSWRVVVEYEGDQHRTDRRQWNRDAWRQERLVEDGHGLVRVTSERMRAPRTVVLAVHQALVEGGHLGPGPVFSAEWRALFATAQ